jgi:ribosomal protein S18 acetylase RimI-like enzyme
MTSAASRETHLIAEDAFLSDVLGRRVGQLDANRFDSSSEELPHEVRRFDFAWSKVSTDEPPVVTRLLRMGFDLVVTELQFERSLGRERASDAASPPGIREATPDDEGDVVKIAKEAFRDDRFHRDSKVGVNAAAAVKGKWASNFFSGARGDRMFIATDDAGNVGGFILLIDSGSTTVIDLVAVAPHAQRRGLGERLVAAAIGSAGSRTDRVLVGTQITNSASVRLYTRLGFTVVSSSHVIHYHRDHVVAPR